MLETKEGIKLESRDCPLCGRVPYTVIGKGYDYDYRTTFHEFEYRRCRTCGVVFPDMQPIHGELHKVYEAESYWQSTDNVVVNSSTFKKQWLFRNGRLIERLKKIAAKKPNFRLLDIGSGRGDLFWILKEIFPQGEYHSIDLHAEMKVDGVNHHIGYIEDYDFGDLEFDMITSQHNIEHVYSPPDYLVKAQGVLAKDGVMFICTPNVDGLEFRVFQKKLYCAGYSIPRHLTLFNHRSFQAMVDATPGLKTEWMGNFFTIHHWVGLVHHALYDLTKSDSVDKWCNYNNLLLSVPLYAFDLLRYKLGMTTGVLETTLVRSDD